MNVLWLSVGGVLLVIFAIVGFLVAKTRQWILAMVAGMAYWLVLEAIHLGAKSTFGVSTVESYLLGVALSLIVFTVWLALTEPARNTKARARRFASQIEHTPLRPQELTRRI